MLEQRRLQKPGSDSTATLREHSQRSSSIIVTSLVGCMALSSVFGTIELSGLIPQHICNRINRPKGC
jgi:hypothetical protein